MNFLHHVKSAYDEEIPVFALAENVPVHSARKDRARPSDPIQRAIFCALNNQLIRSKVNLRRKVLYEVSEAIPK